MPIIQIQKLRTREVIDCIAFVLFHFNMYFPLKHATINSGHPRRRRENKDKYQELKRNLHNSGNENLLELWSSMASICSTCTRSWV